jgi:hypothetical protein
LFHSSFSASDACRLVSRLKKRIVASFDDEAM